MKTYLPNTITWLALSALTLSALLGAGEKGEAALVVILAAAAGKFLLIAWQYMELRHGHRFWILWLSTLLAAFLSGAALLH